MANQLYELATTRDKIILIELSGNTIGEQAEKLEEDLQKTLENYGKEAKILNQFTGNEITVENPKIYRVWLNTSTGDRRELARYKAYSIENVKQKAKEDLFEQTPELIDQYHTKNKTYITWIQIPDREETELEKEEYQKAKEFGELGTTYSLEIEKDNSATFPMQTITGEGVGQDLTN